MLLGPLNHLSPTHLNSAIFFRVCEGHKTRWEKFTAKKQSNDRPASCPSGQGRQLACRFPSAAEAQAWPFLRLVGHIVGCPSLHAAPAQRLLRHPEEPVAVLLFQACLQRGHVAGWKVDVAKCHACHAKRRGATASPKTKRAPATQSERRCQVV